MTTAHDRLQAEEVGNRDAEGEAQRRGGVMGGIVECDAFRLSSMPQDALDVVRAWVDERRWVVRDLETGEYEAPRSWTDKQRRARRHTLERARRVRDQWRADGFAHVSIVRLITRAEAVSRAERRGYLRALGDVASILERCAQSQDHAAWEAAQAGLTALVAKHETVACAYRLAAKTAKEAGNG